jgi:hypothetical protein
VTLSHGHVTSSRRPVTLFHRRVTPFQQSETLFHGWMKRCFMAEMKRLSDRGTEFGPTAARHAALIYGHRE